MIHCDKEKTWNACTSHKDIKFGPPSPTSSEILGTPLLSPASHIIFIHIKPDTTYFLRGSNIIENMVTMMEKHANHLEQLVEERTRQLNEEKEKTEKILYRLLPP